MNSKYKSAFLVLFLLGLVIFAFSFIDEALVPVLYPSGIIGEHEKRILVIATILMLIVVIPVFFLTFYYIWEYRASNKKALYKPEWDNSILAEVVWWGGPFLIVIALSILAWQKTHELDPYRPIDTEAKPITIQVIALQWKWLFIYPEENIATVNYIQFPKDVPLNFEITADAPMNSFWIPALGGQIYAMPGMRTKLHLIADQFGDFRGSSANISGEGFAGMTFTAKASTQEEYDQWVASVKKSDQELNYNELLKPSSYNPIELFRLNTENLFNEIVMKYMVPHAG